MAAYSIERDNLRASEEPYLGKGCRTRACISVRAVRKPESPIDSWERREDIMSMFDFEGSDILRREEVKAEKPDSTSIVPVANC